MDSKKRIVLLSEELATVELNNAILEEDSVNEEVHRVTKAAAALESVMYLLDDDQKEIPVTPSQREMGLAAIAVDQAGALMEVPVGDIVASMESYDGTDTGARVIMEDLKERVVAIWKSLIAMLKKLAQWLKDQIGDYVTTVGMLDKRADRIINAVKEGKVSSNGSKSVDDSALKSRLYSPNVNGKAIDTEYRTYTDAMKVALESATVFIKDPSLIKVEEWLKHANLDKDSMLNTGKIAELMEVVIKAAKNGAKTLFDNREGDAEKFGDIKPAEGCRIYSSPLFLGNIGYYMQCPEKSTSLIHLRFSRYSGEDGEIGDLRELNKAQIAVCMAAWKVVKDLKKRFDDAQEILEMNAKMVDYLQNSHDNAESWKSSFFRFQLSVARAYITMVSTAALFSPAHLIKVSRDVFRLCEYSLDVSEAGSS